MVTIVALSMVSALASESAAAESTKLLEGLLERMEEQDKKIVELNEKVIFKIARLDANYRDGLSAKDKELAAQAKEIAALREGDTEREAQIATLRERLQARADKKTTTMNTVMMTTTTTTTLLPPPQPPNRINSVNFPRLHQSPGRIKSFSAPKEATLSSSRGET